MPPFYVSKSSQLPSKHTSSTLQLYGACVCVVDVVDVVGVVGAGVPSLVGIIGTKVEEVSLSSSGVGLVIKPPPRPTQTSAMRAR